MIGKTISHYEIIEKLGGGGMGVVYKAKDTKLDRFVALKFLPPHVSTDEEEKQRFIHEAKAASALQHNNTCTVFEIDETNDGQMFIAMDYYEGATLKKKIEKGPLKLEEALDIAIQVSEGLNEAHSSKIVHRDIKPANIFITNKNVVKILDFGLAKLAGQSKITKEGSTLGTTGYMSPEQAKGEEADHRTDIWSLGVVLYEMITGQKPFKGDYDQSVLYAIMNETHESITGLRTGVPMELERLIDKTLKKNPSERYQTVGDMLVDLKAINQDTEPTMKVRPAEAKEKVEKKKTLRKVIIPVAAVLVLILAVLMLRSFIAEEVLGSAKIPVAVIPFENRTGDTQYDNLNIMIQDLLITKLSDSKYMYVSTRERMRDVIKQLDMTEEEIDSDSWFEVCRFDGVEAVVIGSMSKAGETFVTDVKVLDVESKELIESASAKGEGVASILNSQIDELGKGISRIIGLSERKIEESPKPVREVTTTSMEAYNYYLKGKEENWGYRHEEAQKYLRMAIKMDSTFAMAYLWLGRTYYLLGKIEEAKETFAKAKLYAEKTTQKESMFIEACYTGVVEMNPEKSMRIYIQMMKKYPKEKEVYYRLAGHYSDERRIEFLKKAITLDPNFGRALNSIAYQLMEIEKYEEALEYLQRYASVMPGAPNPIDSIAEVLFKMGRIDEAITKYKETLKIDPYWDAGWVIAYIRALKEEYDQGMKELDDWIDEQRSEKNIADGYYMKGLYNIILGNFKLSIYYFNQAKHLYEEIANSRDLAWVSYSLGWIHVEHGKYDLGRSEIKRLWDNFKINYPNYINTFESNKNVDFVFIYLREGNIDRAKSEFLKLESLVLKVEEIELLWYNYELLKGMILLADNKPEDAISWLKKASYWQPNLGLVTFLSHSYFLYNRDVLGQAYHQNGGLDKAIAEYERITRFNPEDNDRLLIHPKYHYRLAKLYEEKGLTDKAIERYEKFLGFWKDADEDLPEKQDAKVRLARLKG